MVFVKRKPIIFYPLPSLTDVLQPIQPHITDPASMSSPQPSSSDHKSADPTTEAAPIPPDGKDDEEQMAILTRVFRGEYAGAQGHVGPGKGKKAGTRVIATAHGVANTTANRGRANGTAGSGAHEGEEHEAGEEQVLYRIWDRDSYFIPETGEVFTDYE